MLGYWSMVSDTYVRSFSSFRYALGGKWSYLENLPYATAVFGSGSEMVLFGPFRAVYASFQFIFGAIVQSNF